MDNYFCPACLVSLKQPKLEQYNLCSNCGSVVLLSEQDSASANKDYFNRVANIFDEKKIIHQRESWFYKAEKYYKKFRIKKYLLQYDKVLSACNDIMKDKKVLEIGFGNGAELYQRLRQGIDSYGIDLSEENCRIFKKRYPEYADRVFVGNAEDINAASYDIVYSNALFEHLDDPRKFLNGAFNSLSGRGGYMIIKCPVIYRNEFKYKKYQNFDINFWKPCHRVLYTIKGMRSILNAFNGEITAYGLHPYMGYNVMSLMIKSGITIMEDIRNPFYDLPELRSQIKYLFFLFKAFFYTSICADSIFIIRKK